ncbi:MAG TPA: TIGR02587 family membrane protein [Azospirillum sp.]|nr:TIGR02587 family membrane protein [Azospirillum sp.]
MDTTRQRAIIHNEEHFARALARAAAGAVIFAFPLLMTMEMWELGFYMNRFRLALFLVVTLPVLFGLSYFAGFEATFRWQDDLVDALTAFGVGFIASTVLLFVFGIITVDQPLPEIVGKVALQSVPASIGAMLARKQLGQQDPPDEERRQRSSYPGELFLMAVGALFVGFNVAPTEEMVLIAYKMSPWHTVALAFLSLGVLHIFVYAVGFAGQESPGDATFRQIFLRFTIAGYGIALLISLYLLWTFERMAGLSMVELVTSAVVLGFPGALGAATARLIV